LKLNDLFLRIWLVFYFHQNFTRFWNAYNTEASPLVTIEKSPLVFAIPKLPPRIDPDDIQELTSCDSKSNFTLLKGGSLLAITSLDGNCVVLYKHQLTLPTLSLMCRDVIRKAVDDRTAGLTGLPIPNVLKNYLNYYQ